MYARLYVELYCFDVLSLAVTPGLVLGMKEMHKGRKKASGCTCAKCNMLQKDLTTFHPESKFKMSMSFQVIKATKHTKFFVFVKGKTTR